MYSIINEEVIDIPTGVNNNGHTIVDGRMRKLSKLCKKYPALEDIAPIDYSIFSKQFKKLEDVYYTVYVFCFQYGVKVKPVYGKLANCSTLTFNFKCSSAKIKCYYTKNSISLSIINHNHDIQERKVLNINDNIEKLVLDLMETNNSNSKQVLDLLNKQYSLNKHQEQQIRSIIRTISKNKNDHLEGKINFFDEITKYEHYDYMGTTLVILDPIRLQKYSTLLADGTFSIFLDTSQLYHIYTQVSPKLFLIVAFAITANRNSDTYDFIYTHLNHNKNILSVIHDREPAIMSALKKQNIKLVSDSFHVLMNIKNKELKQIVKTYLQNPNEFDMNNIDEKYRDYIIKYQLDNFGAFGCHSTSCIESLNNKIKNMLKHKRSRYDVVLHVLEEIYNEQKSKIYNEVKNKNMISNIGSLLWNECASALYSEMENMVNNNSNSEYHVAIC